MDQKVGPSGNSSDFYTEVPGSNLAKTHILGSGFLFSVSPSKYLHNTLNYAMTVSSRIISN
jgi:hypothetical protein